MLGTTEKLTVVRVVNGSAPQPPETNDDDAPLEAVTAFARPARRQLSTRKEQAHVVKTIGQRLKDARELCNLSQHVAAKRLGYQNPSRLSRLEKATDINSVPLWLIVRAAELYDVSIDYLFGVTDDFEVGERMCAERKMTQWLARSWEIQRARDMRAIESLYEKVALFMSVTAQMLPLAQEAHDSLQRMRTLNPEFDDMKAGSKALNSSQRAAEAAIYSQRLINKFLRECEIAARQNPQLDFPF